MRLVSGIGDQHSRWGCLFPGRPEEEYRHQLGRYGISGELAMRPVVSLSGGQKSRVAFAQMTMPW